MPDCIKEIRVTRDINGRISAVDAMIYNSPEGKLVSVVSLPTKKISFKQTGSDLGSIKFEIAGHRVKFVQDES